MTFLRNTWYCAAWSNEVNDAPLGRTLLGERVVLYRREDGAAVALGDICPHRFAPMHLGKVRGDAIECPYHGLQFGEGGECVLNPHGEIIPPALRLKSYPIIERHGAAWIWMGDHSAVDPARIPVFPAHDDPNFVTVSGVIKIGGNYQLVSDNLLDLSHTQYLHPVLTHEKDELETKAYEVQQDGDTVITRYSRRNVKTAGFTRFVWPDATERVNTYTGVRWQAPANMLLKVNFSTADGTEETGLHTAGAELVTPETETTCHYFWSNSRDFRRHDVQFSDAMRSAIERVFSTEDGMIIREVQANMGGQTDLMALHPVILPSDGAGVRARRILRKLLAEEAARPATVLSSAA